jgi:hypothetical protein
MVLLAFGKVPEREDVPSGEIKKKRNKREKIMKEKQVDRRQTRTLKKKDKNNFEAYDTSSSAK